MFLPFIFYLLIPSCKQPIALLYFSRIIFTSPYFLIKSLFDILTFCQYLITKFLIHPDTIFTKKSFPEIFTPSSQSFLSLSPSTSFICSISLCMYFFYSHFPNPSPLSTMHSLSFLSSTFYILKPTDLLKFSNSSLTLKSLNFPNIAPSGYNHPLTDFHVFTFMWSFTYPFLLPLPFEFRFSRVLYSKQEK